ncbi:hypothetical protein IOD16_16260 [Saccharothrix sp. 6-C]|uniref:hypothetical protein n=1 Tax=Saccharothrix sp. 6-C TaxID=2781735 RepID=UPI001917847C|nr:hypothetical protein [Saccharothrix sp. 6-C]QQQ79805.1 hypothetical protein IOD16_16260 [Saccharothrix sp. 6-C]
MGHNVDEHVRLAGDDPVYRRVTVEQVARFTAVLAPVPARRPRPSNTSSELTGAVRSSQG